MRITFWASAFAACLAVAPLPGHAAERVVTASGLAIEATTAGETTRFRLTPASGKPMTLTASRDATVARAAALSKLEIIGESPPSLVVVTDSYPSKRLGLSRCGSGQERFLRAIRITDGIASQVFRLKIESCVDDVELASPGLTWVSVGPKIEVKWLQGPFAKGQAATLVATTGP